MSPSRRRLLSGTVTGMVTVCTGCTALVGRSRTRIGEIILLNMNTSVHTVRVRLRANRETLYDTRIEVPPAGQEPSPVITQSDGLPTESREYTIIADLTSAEDSIERTYPQGGGDCYSVTIRIGADGTFRDMPVEPEFEGCRR